MPVSETAMTTSEAVEDPSPLLPPACSLLTPTRTSPWSVNFNALLNRLITICRKRASSVKASPTSSSTSHMTSTPVFPSVGPTVSQAPCTSGATLKVEGSISTRPASTLDRSRISLIRLSRWSALSWTLSRFSRWRSVRFSARRRVTSRVKPMMAFIGVRSSWDIVARNCDFRRVASWICSFASSRSTFFASRAWKSK